MIYFAQFVTMWFSDIIVHPPTFAAIISLLAGLSLLIVSGFVSASEIAFFSLSPADIAVVGDEKTMSDKKIVYLLKNPEHLLATILIANDFVNVAIVMLCNYFFLTVFSFGEASKWMEFILVTVILTFLLLLFGEIMPKIYSKNNVLKFARFSSPVLSVIHYILLPFSTLLAKSTRLTQRLVTKNNYTISVDELQQALELTDESEIQEQRNMLRGIIRFGDEAVTKIMTSRIDMVMLDTQAQYDEVLRCAAENAYSRIPVYSRKRDDIRGVLYIKDLLPYLNRPNSFRWQSLIRQAYFIPQTKMIDDLLCDFQTEHIHIAIVVDEFGGTSGLVTLEDIIEEIVGEINDEFDEPDISYEKLDDKTYIFDGKTLLIDFYKLMKLNPSEFEDVAGEADTLAGLLLELKGEFPQLRETLVTNELTFEVIQRDKHRLAKIKVIMPEVNALEKNSSK